MCILAGSISTCNHPHTDSAPAAPGVVRHNLPRSPIVGARLQLLCDLIAKGDAELARLAEVAEADPEWSHVKLRTWERVRRQKLAAERQAAAAARPRLARTGGACVIDRVRAYLARVPGAVSGQHGHDHTFYVAGRLVRGFDLSVEEAYPLLEEWNQEKCLPQWSEHDLRRKLEQAAKADGPRGFLLNVDADNAPFDPTPPDLSDLEGPLLEPLPAWVLRDVRPAASEIVSLQEVRDKPGRAPAALFRHLSGPPPAYKPCPRSVGRLMEGCHDSTAGIDLVVQVRCRCWSCLSCRERRRWWEKAQHVPHALARGTHTWQGTAAEWATFRRRMQRAGVKVGAYGVVQAAGLVVILAAERPDDVPAHPALVRVDGEGAARALAAAVDAVPDDLTPDAGRVRVKPFRPTAEWGETSDLPEHDAAEVGEHPATGEGDTPTADPPLFRAVPGRLAVNIARAEEIIAGYVLPHDGAGCRRGHLADAPHHPAGGIEDSLLWQPDLGDRQAIRDRLLGEQRPEYAVPSSAAPGSLLADLLATNEVPVPW